VLFTVIGKLLNKGRGPVKFAYVKAVVPVLVAVRFKACRLFVTGIAGSNPAEGMNVGLSGLLLRCVRPSDPRSQES
jgi:hypothetical protein